MQSTIIAFFAVLTSLAVAVPLPKPATMPSMKTRDACDVAKCAIALGPTAVGCGAAIVEAGANPIADIGCLAGGLNAAVNTPAPCAACADELGITKAVGDAASAVGGAVDDAASAVGGAFDDATDAIGDFFD